MSHKGQGNHGTELRDVFDILAKESPERLLSLTFQLGESPEDSIVHALCLIILQKEVEALNKLQMLKDNFLANHLAERLQMSAGKLEDFAAHCSNFQEFNGESLAILARIFKVLTENRLCDPLQRNLAYQRALSTDSQNKTSSCEDLEYDPLREEAKVVCGPQIEEWVGSLRDTKSGSDHNANRSQFDENTTLQITDQTERAHSHPSPLQANSLEPSYPSHLEISIPPTALFLEDKISSTPETSDESKVDTSVPPPVLVPVPAAPEQSQSSEELQPKSNKPESKNSSMMHAAKAEREKLDSHIVQSETTKPSKEPKFAPHSVKDPFVPMATVPKETHESKCTEEEEEEIFYAFVILHAPEDADVAENMKEKLGEVAGCDGATFSEDFAIPGKSTLRCVEDAINNSAFTFLLLSRNFNTRMVNMETDTALINSINKKHKHNTVIPLLPQENCMPKHSIPPVLQTIFPLDEKKLNFEKKVKQVLSLSKIKNLKKIWMEGQKVKRQIERQDELKRLNKCQKELIEECRLAQSLEGILLSQKLLLPDQDRGDTRWQQPQPNIHIENAQYIMIGNDSQMTVDHCGGTDKDDQLFFEDKQ